MKSVNSRRGQTNITHLMNFSLPPRPQYQPQHNTHRPPHRYNRTWGLGSGYHAIDKAKYIHANYRFIVKPDGDYHQQLVDADVHVKWDSVLQILASADTQSTNCPICLSVPVAPRMAKCGHICCLPCLIRYMYSSDDLNPTAEKRARWKKCPICEDSIYISEVRPVRWFQGQEASMLREGGDVLLRLLKRKPGTTIAIPRDSAETHGQPEEVPWFHVAEMMDYARFMKGGEQYMQEQYDQEIQALEQQEQEDELMYGDENTWTRKAINAIREAQTKIRGIGDPPPVQAQSVSESEALVPEAWDEDPSSTSALTSGIQRLGMGNTGSRKLPFYFYHALPNFFLSPLDIRILKSAYGDFSAFPSTLLPRVEHISTGHVVDDDLKKRAKYMSHLPHGCEVSFLECDWTDIIPPAILSQFTDDIEKRRRRNSEKEAREERDRARAERDEDNKRWAAARQKRPSIIEKSFSEADFTPLVNASISSTDGGLSQTPPWANQRSHSTFASLASPSTSPDHGSRTVWGTTAVGSASPSAHYAVARPPMDDGWLQDWEKDLLDEADAVALVEASISGEGSSKSGSVNNLKKGKKKKITLMSTNVRRGA